LPDFISAAEFTLFASAITPGAQQQRALAAAMLLRHAAPLAATMLTPTPLPIFAR